MLHTEARDLPVIYASFGESDPPPKVTVKSDSDFEISLNCTQAAKNQWARVKGKQKKF